MKYQVILADPPWFYNSRKTGNELKNKTKFGGGAEKHYPLMKDEEILQLSSLVENMMDNNCALFLWATGPRLDLGTKVIQQWGFRYCTIAFVWVKVTQNGGLIYNPGYYTASNAELVLLGVRGNMKPSQPMIQQVIMAQRGRHSEKPDEVRNRIELMYPNSSKIELFARKLHAGWDAWGNEINAKGVTKWIDNQSNPQT